MPASIGFNASDVIEMIEEACNNKVVYLNCAKWDISTTVQLE